MKEFTKKTCTKFLYCGALALSLSLLPAHTAHAQQQPADIAIGEETSNRTNHRLTAPTAEQDASDLVVYTSETTEETNASSSVDEGSSEEVPSISVGEEERPISTGERVPDEGGKTQSASLEEKVGEESEDAPSVPNLAQAAGEVSTQPAPEEAKEKEPQHSPYRIREENGTLVALDAKTEQRLPAGWIQHEGRDYFVKSDGTLYQNQIITFGKTAYYIGGDGSKQKGAIRTADNAYNLDEETGALLRQAGWFSIGDEDFFSDAEGRVYRGQWISFGPKVSYFMDATGAKRKGVTQVGEEFYHLDAQTGVLLRQAGWVDTEKGSYFSRENGQMYRNQLLTFGRQIAFYVGADGLKQFGAVQTPETAYNLDLETGILIQKAGWLQVGGKEYFLNEQGRAYRNQLITFGPRIAYFMGADSSKQFGKGIYNGTFYNLDEQTGILIQQAGWQSYGGRSYFTNDRGMVYRNQPITFGSKLLYYMGADGSAQTGWQNYKEQRYYLDRNGIAAAGWQNIAHSLYYFVPSTKSMARGVHVTEQGMYYFDPSSGILRTGNQAIRTKHGVSIVNFAAPSRAEMENLNLDYSGKVSARQRILQLAFSELGNDYVWAAASPSVGFDCSGLVKWAYAQAVGIKLPHYTVTQAAFGRSVSRSTLKPGDLLFFNNTGFLTHVGIYIGNNRMIHSANPNKGVEITELLSGGYWDRTFATGRSLL